MARTPFPRPKLLTADDTEVRLRIPGAVMLGWELSLERSGR